MTLGNHIEDLARQVAIWQKKRFALEEGIALAIDPEQRASFEYRLEHSVLPKLEEVEDRYAAALAGAVGEMQLDERDVVDVLTDLDAGYKDLERHVEDGTPDRVVRALEEIAHALRSSDGKNSGRLKFAVPLIPMLVQYEAEVSTSRLLAGVLTRIRELVCVNGVAVKPAQDAADALPEASPAPSEERVGNQEGAGWYCQAFNDSWYHSCDAERDANLLIVYVHGYGGHALKTWGDLPQWVLAKAGFDADVLMFGYPTLPTDKADICDAAGALGLLLREKVAPHRHIVFVTHSTGGLVVKELLHRDVVRWTSDVANTDAGVASSGSITLQTRLVVNFAVPHSGVGVLVTIALALQYIRNVCRLPFVKLIGVLRGGQPRFGYNKLLLQLMYRNRWLLRLGKDYNKRIWELQEKDLPRPVNLEVLARDDPVVARSDSDDLKVEDAGQHVVVSDEDHIVAPRTHSTVKLPSSSSDVVVAILANRLMQYERCPEMAIAAKSLERIIEIDGIEGVECLVDGDTGAEKDRGTFLWAGSQEFARNKLASRIQQSRFGDVVVVTGDAGVGKSVVLRRAAAKLATEFLSAKSKVRRDSLGRRLAPLPVFLPLQQMALRHEQLAADRGDPDKAFEPRILWAALCEYWCGWARKLLSESGDWANLDVRWLENWIAAESTVVILDGVDEFLMNNPFLDIEDVRSVLDHLEGRFGTDGPNVILGARKSMPALEELVSSNDDVIEVLPLTLDQAESRFPGSRKLLERVSITSNQQLMLTPLVLVHLGPRLTELDDAKLQTRSGILDEALRALLKRSGLSSRRRYDGVGDHIDDWVDALTLLAWRYFAEYRGEVELGKVVREIEALRSTWGHTRQTLSGGFDILGNDSARHDLMSRTVFLPSGRGFFRFRHREWEDYLVARYVAYCLRNQVITEMGARGFNKQIYMAAANELNLDRPRTEITADYMRKVLSTDDHDRRQYVIGNFLALLGNTKLPFGDGALKVLVGAVQAAACPEVARIVMLGSFMSRVLRSDPNDPALTEIRECLDGMIHQMSLGRTKVWSGLTASMAWCFRATLSGGEGALPAWPGLSESGVAEQDTLAVLCTKTADGYRPIGQQKSIQAAWARMPILAGERPKDVIALVHYLYAITLTFSVGGSTREVRLLLKPVFESDSPMRDAIQAVGLSELERIFSMCELLYERGGG